MDFYGIPPEIVADYLILRRFKARKAKMYMWQTRGVFEWENPVDAMRYGEETQRIARLSVN